MLCVVQCVLYTVAILYDGDDVEIMFPFFPKHIRATYSGKYPPWNVSAGVSVLLILLYTYAKQTESIDAACTTTPQIMACFDDIRSTHIFVVGTIGMMKWLYSGALRRAYYFNTPHPTTHTGELRTVLMDNGHQLAQTGWKFRSISWNCTDRGGWRTRPEFDLQQCGALLEPEKCVESALQEWQCFMSTRRSMGVVRYTWVCFICGRKLNGNDTERCFPFISRIRTNLVHTLRDKPGTLQCCFYFILV